MLVLSGMLSSCSVLHVKMYCMPTEGKYHIVTVIHECYFKIIFAHTGGGFFFATRGVFHPPPSWSEEVYPTS